MILIVAESAQSALVISRALNATDAIAPATYVGANETIVAIDPGFISVRPIGSMLHNSPFKESLPLIPKTLYYGMRETEMEGRRKVSVADRAEDERLRTLFDEAEEVVFASDGGADAQSRFGNICLHFKVGVPTSRMWLTSLDYTVIRRAFRNREHSRSLHRLAQSGFVSAAMDLLFDYNVSQAFASAYGQNSFPVRRQDLLALDFIGKHERDAAGFERGAPKFTVSVTVDICGEKVNLCPADIWEDEAECRAIHEAIDIKEGITLLSAEVNPVRPRHESLYTLCTLQADAFEQLGMMPSRTLAVATILFEKGLISSPLTTRSGLPGAMRKQVVKRYPGAETFPFSHIPEGTNHGIITTERNPLQLSPEENALRNLIIRQQECAFTAPDAIAELEVCIEVNGIMYAGMADVAADFFLPEDGLEATLCGKSISRYYAPAPKPLTFANTIVVLAGSAHATQQMLLPSAHYNPATDGYGVTMERLVKNGYLSVLCGEVGLTDKGKLLMSYFKDSDILDMLNMFQFEADDLFSGSDLTSKQVIEAFKHWLHDEVSDLLANPGLTAQRKTRHICPRCKQGEMTAYNRTVRCEHCRYTLPRQVSGLELTDKQLEQLVVHGYTSPIYGFVGRKGHKYTEALVLDANFGVTFAPKEANIY